MMSHALLTLDVVAHRGRSPSCPHHLVLDTPRMTIGSRADNTLVLPASREEVEPVQCAIELRGEGWQVTNVGVALPVVVAGKELRSGVSNCLDSGNFIEIGPYVIAVGDHEPASGGGIPGVRAASAVPWPSLDAKQQVHPEQAFGAGDHQDAVKLPTRWRGLTELPLDPLQLFAGSEIAEHSQMLHNGAASARNAGDTTANLLCDLLYKGNFTGTRRHDGGDVPRTGTTSSGRDDIPEGAVQASNPDFGLHETACVRPPGEGETGFSLAVPGGRASSDDPVAMGADVRFARETHAGLFLLANAFLEGAGIAPETVGRSGVTPETMRHIGQLFARFVQISRLMPDFPGHD